MSLTNKTVLSYVSLIAFGLLSLLLGTSIGTVSISFLDILKVIVNKVMPTPIFENIESMQENIIWNIRLPRVLLAGFVGASLDRKSTRLNSSHVAISYAVFCL